MNSQALLDQIKEHEGFVSHAYQDSLGFWTIGIGRLVDKRRGGGITEFEARTLLLHDLNRVMQELDSEVPWWRALGDARQRVLVDMCFQLGIGGLLRFTATLRAMKAGDYGRAADQMLKSLWARRQTPNRARRLALMMREGRSVAMSEVR